MQLERQCGRRNYLFNRDKNSNGGSCSKSNCLRVALVVFVIVGVVVYSLRRK